MRTPPTRKQKKSKQTEAIYGVMQQMLLREYKIHKNKVHFWIICLSERGRITLIELLRYGVENAGPVDPADVFSFALQKQARKLILVHNHPKEAAPAPTEADMDLTNRMYHVGKFFNLPVLDHLIINEETYFSFAEAGLLEKIALDKKYALEQKPGRKAAPRKKAKAGVKKRKAK